MPRLLQSVTRAELRKIQTLLHSVNNHTVPHGLEFSLRDPASAKCPPVWKVVGIPTLESTESMRIPHYCPFLWLHELIPWVLALVLFLVWVQNPAKEWLPSSTFRYLQWAKLSFSKCQASEKISWALIFPPSSVWPAHFWDPPLSLNSFPFLTPWWLNPQNSTEQHILGGNPWDIWASELSLKGHCTSSVFSREKERFWPPLAHCPISQLVCACPVPKAPHRMCSLRLWQRALLAALLLTQPNVSLGSAQLNPLLSLSDSLPGLLKCNLIK